jgi:hypothetical protein
VKVKVTTDWTFNGKAAGQATRKFFDARVKLILAQTKVFAETNSASDGRLGQLEVTVNDDVGAMVGKALALVFSFGLIGVDAVQNYDMTVTYTPVDGKPIVRKYKHAIHQIAGAKSAPEGMDRVLEENAGARIVDDMFYNFLRDIQKDGTL